MFTDKIIEKQGIVNSLGEVVLEPVTYTVKERSEVPFRSITDLKGYSDNEVFVEPSNTDISGYVDNRIIIDKIMRDVPLDLLSMYGAQISHASGDQDFDDEEFDIPDHLDELDIVTAANAAAGAIAEAQSKNQINNPNADDANERSEASEDKSEA